jgi:hypothetical protein
LWSCPLPPCFSNSTLTTDIHPICIQWKARFLLQKCYNNHDLITTKITTLVCEMALCTAAPRSQLRWQETTELADRLFLTNCKIYSDQNNLQ